MSTRTIIGGIGAVAGFFVGGPQGAYYGWALGSMVGNAVDPQTIKGPRVGEISEQTSKEGGPIPIIFSRSPPITGNIIASGDARIIKKKKRQGKGGPKVETETVLRTYAVGVCEGEVRFVRVWRNGQIVYDVTDEAEYHDESGQPLAVLEDVIRRKLDNNAVWLEKVRFYGGTFDQEPDPDLEAIFGVGSTAAHRGVAYMVVVDDDLTDTRGAVPQYVFQVEVGSDGEARLVYEVGVHEWEKPSGLESVDYIAFGAGGGAGAGGRQLPDSAGGMGGGGGEIRYGNILAADLGDTEAITVGAGGNGGLHVQGGGTLPGNNGTDGGDTTFGTHVTAKGGEGGAGGLVGGSTLGDGGGPGTGGDGELGGDGGLGTSPSSPSNLAPSPGESTLKSGPGGGGGGGRTNVGATDGGSGGSVADPVAVGGLGGAKGTATTEAQDGAVGQHGENDGAGAAGGGGGACATGSYTGSRRGGNGGNGGTPGGGGGGGGGVVQSTFPSGDGGDGGDGRLILYQNFDAVTSSLQDVVAAICARAGIASGSIDVSLLSGGVRGYLVTNLYPAMEAIQGLAQVFLFDMVSVDRKLRFVPRGANTVATITTDDLCADEDDKDQAKRADPLQVPRVLNLNYHDIAGQLSTDKQTSERDGDRRAVGEAQLQTAVILSADEAARVVHINHKVMIEDQRGEYAFSLPDKFLRLIASDPIFFQHDGETVRLRITRVDTFDGYQEYTALQDRQSAYVSTVEGYPAAPTQMPASQSVGPTLLRVLDIPLQLDSDDAKGLLLYIAASGTEEAWQGATVEISYDGGANYNDYDTIEVSATMGALTTDLPDHPAEFPDVTNTFRVQLQTAASELEETDLAGMLNRVNRAMVGAEIIQFAGAQEVEPRVWELSTLLRGRQGTETSDHPAGESFVLIDSYGVLPMSVTDLGRTLMFRATSIGATSDTGTVTSIAFTGATQTERRVGYLSARRDGSDLIVEWQGVGRLGGGAQVAHGARFEGYRVTISDGILPDVVVDTDDQTLTQGVGALGSPLTVTVQQLNGLTGAGPAATVEIP